VCVLLVVAGYWAVTSWAPLRDRFSEGDVSLSVGGVNINAEGRTKVWSVLWSEAQDEILVGRGPGAASARSVAMDPAFDHPHNDYLRIVYDFGLVGLGLLGWFVVRTTRLLRRARRRARDAIPPLAALYAGVAVLLVMATDNPLDYPFVMIPLGALLGLGLGVTVTEPRRSRSASESAPVR
jgi:O-antigen ligase